MTRSEEIAWAAGLFEGEGCFSVSKRSLTVQVVMTDEDVVRRFATVMGFGKVRSKSTGNPKHKPQWLWIAQTRAEFTRTLEMFEPWLGERRLARAREILTGLELTDFVTVSCQYCGKTELLRRTSASVRKKYCSRNHKHLAWQKRNLERVVANHREWRHAQRARALKR